MNSQTHHEFVELRRCAQRGQAELYALVLSARGIGSAIATEPDGFTLFVASADEHQAREELTAYDSENEARPAESKRPPSNPPDVEFLLAYWAVLLFFF